MNKISFHEIEARAYESPKKHPDFDTCYYPDSDKVSVHPSFHANKEGLTRWTRVSEGGIDDYWQGEE